jgi:isoleucyl-tRNA synthetase
VDSIEELERLGGPAPEDLHRPFVDRVTWPCATPGCAGTMRRTPEVADAWFDSGAMPFAQWHFPFENKERIEEEHPADFVSEGVDQTRGWFYTLLAVSALLVDRPAYKACASLDLVLDAKGKKMSKSKGNVVDPFEMIAKYGADVVRWHLLARPLGTPLRYEEKDLLEIRNRFFGTLLNVYVFLATYANVDGWTPAPATARLGPFDRWVLSRLHRLARDVDAALAEFDTGRAGQRVTEFVVEDLSNWYVRRNRRRFFAEGLDADKKAAYATLHECLVTVTRLCAPLIPFLPDALHRELLPDRRGVAGSVHLADWPQAVAHRIDDALEAGMEAARRVVSLGHAVRDEAGIRVRQPLPRAVVWGLGDAERAFVAENADVVRDELNVKELVFVAAPGSEARLRATLDKKEAARRLGARTPAVTAALEALEPGAVAALVASPKPVVATPEGPVELKPGDVRVLVEGTEGHAGAFGHGLLVVLEVRVSPEMEAEGIAREVVRRLNEKRKSLGLRVQDRVKVSWHADGAARTALGTWGGWIASEVLAVSFDRAPGPQGLEDLGVQGHEVFATVETA